MSEYTYFATAARGLEPVVAAELRALGFDNISETTGGVAFQGSLAAGYKANLWLRSATRVLLRLAHFPAQSPQALYEAARQLPWEEFLSVYQTLAVHANVRDSAMTHSHYVALKTKDAIVDRFRDKFGRRPSVDTRMPDVQINVHLAADQCTISLDMSGDSLHKRGYRTRTGSAPLNEALAAGILHLAGYDGTQPFYDPMCGSGTFVIEAALIAGNIAPGLTRERFGFMSWSTFAQESWHELLQEAREAQRPIPAPIAGSDISGPMITMALKNARRANVLQHVKLRRSDISEVNSPAETGIVLCNPPYGERIGEKKALQALYRRIGDVYKQRFRGYNGFIFTGNIELLKSVGLKTNQRIILYNGPIESRLVRYALY